MQNFLGEHKHKFLFVVDGTTPSTSLAGSALSGSRRRGFLKPALRNAAGARSAAAEGARGQRGGVGAGGAGDPAARPAGTCCSCCSKWLWVLVFNSYFQLLLERLLCKQADSNVVYL